MSIHIETKNAHYIADDSAVLVIGPAATPTARICIAALPELLAALEEIRSKINTFNGNPILWNVADGEPIDWRPLLARADAAIAKARGE